MRVPLLHSLQTKFALTYILIIAAVLLVLNTYPVLASQDLVFQTKRDSLQSQTAVLSSGLAGLETITNEGAQQIMDQLGNSTFNQIVVTDPKGRVLYDSDFSSQSLGSVNTQEELATALTGKDVFRSVFEGGAFQSWAAAPVVTRGQVIGAVTLFEYDTEQAELLLGIVANLRNISAVICLVAIAMSLFFSKALTRRIGVLLGAMSIVREGEYSHRVKLSGGDELSQLADEFNQLTGRLQTTDEVRRRFVSDASHELKTPLASIRLLTDSILQNENIDPVTAKEFITDIGQEADRLTRITEKLLTLTRMDDQGAPPQEEIVAFAPILEKVAHMLAPLAQAGQVTLTSTLEPACMVRASEDNLYQIAFNLMENAIKYNLPGGWVSVTLAGTDSGVVLRVEDTGMGIPQEDLAKVFDRFYRVDKARSRAAGGTGLGLSIVRDMVRLYGGTVEARQRDPEGTAFVVTFPPV